MKENTLEGLQDKELKETSPDVEILEYKKKQNTITFF